MAKPSMERLRLRGCDSGTCGCVANTDGCGGAGDGFAGIGFLGVSGRRASTLLRKAAAELCGCDEGDDAFLKVRGAAGW